MIYIESLRYICILCTKENRSLFKTEDSKKKMREIILNYFDQMKEKEEEVSFISASINEKHVEITFETPSSIDLTRFISNFKSVSSRRFLIYLKSIKSNISGIWTKNYLLASQEDKLDQKTESFLQVQEYKSML
ncbi:MAG: transposase [Promethearchaeota archaeon]